MTGESAPPLEPAHLPGLRGARGWHVGRLPSGRAFRVPRLDGAAATGIARRVREAALEARAGRSLDEVVRALGSTGARFGRPGDALRERAIRLLQAELAWPEELAAETLGQMAAIWTEEALRSCLRRELPEPAVLEGWRPEPGERGGSRRHRAAGPPLLLTVHAGNVPGVSVTGALRALLVRSGSLNRVASDEPGLLGLFARGLAEADRLLAASVAATWWPAGRRVRGGRIAGHEPSEADDPSDGDPTWWEWVKRSGKVVVYGGEAAVRAVRERVPGGVDLIPYGPKLGVGVALPDALEGEGAERAAAALARDVLAYEGRGCVTPRLVFACGAGSAGARPFAERLAAALAGEAPRIPRPRPSAEEALAIRALRARYEFGVGAVWGSEPDLSWTVALGDPRPDDWGLLPRVVTVVPIPGIPELERLLGSLRGKLQAIGYAGERGRAELADACARLGAARLAPFGDLAWPPADWHHDGRPQLQPLLEWTDWELPRS